MLAEKYPGYCLKCSEHPPHFYDESPEPVSKSLIYNPWCTLCHERNGKSPTAFWEKGEPGKFSYKCEFDITEEVTDPITQQKISRQKKCDWVMPAVDEKKTIIDTSRVFDKILVAHLMSIHNMGFAEANEKTLEPLRKEVIYKYLVPKPE